MNHFDEDPFCPRHGRGSRPTLTPGLRCLCARVLMEAAGVTVADSVEDAFMLGFDLGAAGGVPPDRVGECARCGGPFYLKGVEVGGDGICCGECLGEVRAGPRVKDAQPVEDDLTRVVQAREGQSDQACVPVSLGTLRSLLRSRSLR